MKIARSWAVTGAVALVLPFTAAVAGPAAASAGPTPARTALRGSLAPAQERAHPAGSVPANAAVSFDLLLSLRNAAGAQAFVKEVSTPGSAQFHHYLTDAQWVARYGPASAAVTKASAWLRSEGFTVGAMPKDRLFVPASGTAAKVEKAFGVTLGYYTVNGHTVRLANGTLSVPSSLAGAVSGAVGVNQYVATPALAPSAGATAATAAPAAKPGQEPPPPAGFRNPQPCSAYWGQKIDTKDSGSLYKPYSHPLPYDICGYVPAQLRGGYGLAGSVASGIDGKGVTIAIVDAYDSPTLLSDAQLYFRLNDPAHPLNSSQFTNITPPTVDDQTLCAGSGWYDEQALDVESSHSMAPGAHILYVGAQDCLDASLLAAVTTAVTSGASVVTDSWDDLLGDVFDDAAVHTAYDDTFMLADATGVTVLFCSHDYGDNFATFGLTIPNYPATSPYVTAVGGTTLEVNRAATRQAEYGWSTASQVLCKPKTTTCGSATTPVGSLGYDNGSAGDTSYYYTEPYYQAPVVPADLALRNEAVNGPVPYRVVPDISMDADPQSGMLIGLTQTFPNGVYYDQFKEGGTSLASPLLAGVIADVDQVSGIPLGFLNPVLYKAYTATPSAFNDILAPANPDSAAVIRVDYANTVDASAGYVVSLRAINYEGPETYCDATGNCATRNVSLTTAPGFDSMTGLGSVGRTFISTLSKY
jgi:subtilase family serine protease